MQAEFVLGGMIAQWEEVDGRIVLSDDTGVAWSWCFQSGSGVLESIVLIVPIRKWEWKTNKEQVKAQILLPTNTRVWRSDDIHYGTGRSSEWREQTIWAKESTIIEHVHI